MTDKTEYTRNPTVDLVAILVGIYMLLGLFIYLMPFQWPPSPSLHFLGIAVTAIPIIVFIYYLRRALRGGDFRNTPKKWMLCGAIIIGIEAIAEIVLGHSLGLGMFGFAIFCAGLGAWLGTKRRTTKGKHTEQSVPGYPPQSVGSPDP